MPLVPGILELVVLGEPGRHVGSPTAPRMLEELCVWRQFCRKAQLNSQPMAAITVSHGNMPQ